MPFSQRKRRVYFQNRDKSRKREHDRVYYSLNSERIKAHVRSVYASNPSRRRAAARAAYKADPDKKKAAAKSHYCAEAEEKKAAVRAHYNAQPEKKKAAVRAHYNSQPEKKNAADRASYRANSDVRKAKIRAHYHADSEKKKEAVRSAYKAQPDKKREAVRAAYTAQSAKRKAMFKSYHKANRSARLKYFRKYHCCTKRKPVTKAKYRLAQPTLLVIDQYINTLKASLRANAEAMSQLEEAFKARHCGVAKQLSRDDLEMTVCRLAAQRLVSKALQVRKEHAGLLLGSLKSIKSIKLNEESGFGKSCHTRSTEPFFYEAAYQPVVVKDTPIPINERGECVVACEPSENVPSVDSDSAQTPKSDSVPKLCKKWQCHKECRPLRVSEVDAILDFRSCLELSVEEAREALAKCDLGCPFVHSAKLVGSTPVALKGHPIVCYTGDSCTSTLRILRAASTHFPVLRKFLVHVTTALPCHKIVCSIDNALQCGNYKKLMQITNVKKVELLLGNNIAERYQQLNVDDCPHSLFKSPTLEMDLAIAHAALISAFEKEINDFPEHACCCCERLHQRKSVSVVRLSDDLNNLDVWLELKLYIQSNTPDVDTKVLYMCSYCKALIKKNRMPARCVLNGLQTVPIPPELAVLDPLSRQLIQRAKCYQTIVRLGTYTAKVPTYNSLKACKGTMFFLPLPLKRTLETLDDVKQKPCVLPDPELYIIVNGKPTKSNVVWRSLVNVNHIKTAISTLKTCNWLYRDVLEQCIDKSTKHIIEVSNNATTKMLKKASPDEVDAFQAYTIRNLDNKVSTSLDIEQYKLLHVAEEPVSNKQQHLDVMCFPVLFPNGKFGEFHPRKEKLSNSEYIKSRLYNKDSRFRKDPQYVFYLLWQKEMREISSGVYNLLKSSRKPSVSVGMLLEQVNSSDEYLEAHLCTMLQSVRGTKQYWFLRSSELKCMIREFGPPTLFLTFSCAEYESPDITEFVRKVNDAPPKYSVAKLCVEDPVSVSRKYSLKFHAFFREVIMKGQVLGIVDHFYWKKEYQNRGAPHYHVLLWIRDAPVIDRDEPDKVLDFIQERITCSIPDEKASPELHRLVTRYQLHKCSKYCKRRKRCGKTSFVTRCKFGFPRPVSDTAQLNPVQESLKSRNRIYNLARTEDEIRVNDYNPLLLMLWKANIDIQFIAEASLALAHYVSGYVTKAERSNMQEIWQEVSDSKSIYSRLFSFGVRSLRFRESGLYEASDLLLGDHLTEKSCTVKWVDVAMPHKRSRRLKNHKVLQKMAECNPNDKAIFEDNVVDTFYPQRPAKLEHVCLYDFIAQYEFQGIDDQGQRVYRKLGKPKLPNHKIFDPEIESQREDYYYSLVLLFCPFRDESSLILGNETAEQAFYRLLSNQSSSHHAKLKTMLAAASTVKVINDARQAEKLEEKEVEDDDEPQLLGEARTAMSDVLDMRLSSYDQLTLDERESMLNADQRRVFDTVKTHLLHERSHENKKCSCNDLKPLRLFISGVGGTGKSFLIETIKILLTSMWSSDDLLCAVAAPTGLAAFNVGGVTMHRLFQLPIEHSARAAGYWALPKQSQKVMKTTLSNVRLFVIDEISMVSSLNLAYVHMRLEELFSENEWFGSRNMLFVGDLLQLPPVAGSPVFEKVSTKSLLNQLGCAASANIWRDCVTYDELTINERQKNDPQFSSMLDSVRRGCPTEETVRILRDRVIQVPIADKFTELQQSGRTPVCLFPKKRACEVFNAQMLTKTASPTCELYCTDEIDETAGARKMTKKVVEHLEKLNTDCNMTAGLEAKLCLAVGARVMLRRNLDTKAGLVNGAIGTVLSIASNHVTVQFDHVSTPYDVERVKSKFMVMKNFYVYRKQFPLILAYAVTIHKCQGLSLDCAIVDLSDQVFSEGMAYVALSRVRTLEGLFLTAFNPKSLIVSVCSLKEVNRLRQTYRNDLPLYNIPSPSKRKRKLTGVSEVPSAKRVSTESVTQGPSVDIKPRIKRKSTVVSEVPSAKKVSAESVTPGPSSSTVEDDDCVITGEASESPLKFYPVTIDWQQRACQQLGLQYHAPTRVRPGGPNVPLTRPDMRSLKRIQGDGNCLFRALSYIITGSEEQHMAVRNAILDHMVTIAHFLLGHHLLNYDSIQTYIVASGMDEEYTWGTDIEMLTLSHLLNTPIVSYSEQFGNWQRYSPHNVDRTLRDEINQMSMYLLHSHDHFTVVCSVRKR